MSVKDRLLRRLWFLNHLSLLTRELEFYREHKDEKTGEGFTLWRWGDENGTLKID